MKQATLEVLTIHHASLVRFRSYVHTRQQRTEKQLENAKLVDFVSDYFMCIRSVMIKL
jgi:hypothetical protein